jgi:hypothetical protein
MSAAVVSVITIPRVFSVGATLPSYLEVESMQKPVRKRGDDDAHAGDENDPAEEGINAGEQLGHRGVKGRDGTHPGQDHRRVEERVDPGKVGGEVVPQNTDAQRSTDEQRRYCGATTDTMDESATRENGMRRRMLKHGGLALGASTGSDSRGTDQSPQISTQNETSIVLPVGTCANEVGDTA